MTTRIFGFIYRNTRGYVTTRTILNDSLSTPAETSEIATELDDYTILVIDISECHEDKRKEAGILTIELHRHNEKPNRSTLTSEQFLDHLVEHPGKCLRLYQHFLNNYDSVYDERMINVPLRIALVDKGDRLGVGCYLDMDHNKLQ